LERVPVVGYYCGMLLRAKIVFLCLGWIAAAAALQAYPLICWAFGCLCR